MDLLILFTFYSMCNDENGFVRIKSENSATARDAIKRFKNETRENGSEPLSDVAFFESTTTVAIFHNKLIAITSERTKREMKNHTCTFMYACFVNSNNDHFNAVLPHHIMKQSCIIHFVPYKILSTFFFCVHQANFFFFLIWRGFFFCFSLHIYHYDIVSSEFVLGN